MDPLVCLPTEISLRIFELLGPEDLCRCLAVNHRWRQLANTEKYWHCFCNKRSIALKPSKEIQFGKMSLCDWATSYIDYMQVLVNNWKECRYESLLLPKEDWCCSIAGFKRQVAVYYPRTSKVLLYKISSTIDLIHEINLEIPRNISIPDVFINEHYLVICRGNLVLVFNNNDDYSLCKVIICHEFGLTISNDILPFTENDNRIYVKVINEKTIWMEYHELYVIDISSDTYSVLTDTFRCLRIDGKHIYAANDLVSCYDLKGEKEFSLSIKYVEDMWVKNKKMVILKGGDSQRLEVWDLISKTKQCSIPIEREPAVSISPESDYLYVLQINDDLFIVSCFSAKTGSVIWEYVQFFEREIVIHPEIRIICERFLFVRPSHIFDTNYLLLDCKSGEVINEQIMPPCIIPPGYIYHLSDEFFITAESDIINIRSYI